MIGASHTVGYSGRAALAYAKAPAQFCGCEAIVSETDNFSAVLVGEFAHACHRQSRFDGMSMISETGNPFEIGHGIVSLDCIKVVDLRQVLWVWDKGSSDQSVNLGVFEERGIAQVNVNIPPLSLSQFHVATFEVSGPRDTDAVTNHRLPKSGQTANATQITDLVQVSEFGKVNGTPFFGGLGHQISPQMLASFNMAYVATQGDSQCR